LLEHLSDKNIVNKTPELGNYYLTDEELENYSKYDFVFVVDMTLTEDNILRLAKNSKVMVFDHHLGKMYDQILHHNPVIKGGNPDDFPSTSWIINDFLENDVNLFALLGIIGDHEQKIKNDKKINKTIDEFCEKNNLSFDDLHKMVYLLDSNYKLGDKKIVEEAPHFLLKNGTAKDILNNTQWNENLRKIDEEMTKQLNIPADERDGIILKRINTSYNIISAITRKIAWGSGKNTVVINTGFYEDMDQIYVRSVKNAEPMIMRGKSLGFKCGGKKEVLGAIVPKDKSESFINEIIEFLYREK
jgi:nanoRNase/pAp phosphatase (c-di-AMP/oligoRNAs hydrolase)